MEFDPLSGPQRKDEVELNRKRALYQELKAEQLNAGGTGTTWWPEYSREHGITEKSWISLMQDDARAQVEAETLAAQDQALKAPHRLTERQKVLLNAHQSVQNKLADLRGEAWEPI